MCGRARCSLAPEAVTATTGVPKERWIDRERYRPSSNVAPGAWTPIVRGDSDVGRTLQTMQWGLVPSFTKPGEKLDHWKMFNARSETVAEKPVFSRLLPHHRGVVVADGFYEWKTEASGRKQPYYVHFVDGRPMKMAALYDVYRPGGGDSEPLYSYSILTVDSSPRLQWLHNRMPALLPDEAAVDAWLTPAGGRDSHTREEDKEVPEGAQPPGDAGKLVAQVCSPYNGVDLVWHPVTPEMSRLGYDAPDCWQDMRTRKGAITQFFGAKPAKPAAGSAAAKGSSSLDDGGNSKPSSCGADHGADTSTPSPAATVPVDTAGLALGHGSGVQGRDGAAAPSSPAPAAAAVPSTAGTHLQGACSEGAPTTSASWLDVLPGSSTAATPRALGGAAAARSLASHSETTVVRPTPQATSQSRAHVARGGGHAAGSKAEPRGSSGAAAKGAAALRSPAKGRIEAFFKPVAPKEGGPGRAGPTAARNADDCDAAGVQASASMDAAARSSSGNRGDMKRQNEGSILGAGPNKRGKGGEGTCVPPVCTAE